MVCLQIYTHIHVNELVDNICCLFENRSNNYYNAKNA